MTTTTTGPNISVGSVWLDITTIDGSLASADVTIQNVRQAGDDVSVVFGGSEPSGAQGHRLAYGDAITGNAAAIWAKADKDATLACSVAS